MFVDCNPVQIVHGKVTVTSIVQSLVNGNIDDSNGRKVEQRK
jgi:hypothetical protein